MIETILVALALAAAQAPPAPPPPPAAPGVAAAPGGLPGIWSLGDAPNCSSGPAWVFLADGYYGEVKLPSGTFEASGIWRDRGAEIDYTHVHPPYAEALRPMPVRTFRVVGRTADRLEVLSPRGTTRVFHRCPANSIAAPAGPAH